MELEHRIERSLTFDEAAEDYEAARPSYPDEAIGFLVQSVGLTRKHTCLEVGIGTGQATRKLAKLGAPIVGLEPGKNLAAVARRSLSAFRNVDIVEATFEEYSVPELKFDLLYSATAFHWTDPQTRWQKTSDLLKPGGYVAILINKSMEESAQTEFFKAAQPIYQGVKRLRRGDFNTKNTTWAVSDAFGEELARISYFDVVERGSFPFELALTSDDLIRLHMTFSDHLRLPEEERNALFDALRKLADDDFGGEVVKPYETEVIIAQKCA